MGLFYSKPLETTSNILNRFYNLRWSSEWSPTSKNFPLFRLPFLALVEVFKSFDPIELFIISLCTRKTAKCVRIIGSSKWKLSVDVGNKRVEINGSYRINIVETSQKPSWDYDKSLKEFSLEYQNSENSKPELQKALSQLLIAFKCTVTSFKHDDEWKNDQCWVSVLKCITQCQVQSLESLDLTITPNLEDLEWALQNVKVTRKIDIWIANPQRIREQAAFLPSRFLRPDLTMFKSCKYIKLDFSWLTVSALNFFMKEWKAGSFPNPQYMLIESYSFYWHWYDHILEFDRYEMEKLGVKRRLVIDENLWVECTGGVDIQADNGTKATMQMGRRRRDSFELFVWNN